MKNLFFLFLLLQLFLAVSCKKVDTALVAQMDDTIASMQAKTGDYDMNTQGIVNFAQLVDAAPEALRNDTSSGYAALHEKVAAVRTKQEATVAEFKQVLGDLQTTSAEYSAGKISTEQAGAKRVLLTARLTAIQELLGRVTQLNDEAQTEYGKMMAEYRSKTE